MIIFFRLIFIFQLFSLLLFANNILKDEYIIENKTVMLSNIVHNPKKDLPLYTIQKNRHSKRIKASELLKKLHQYGYNDFKAKHAYIQFTQRSPIDTKKIEKSLRSYFHEHYKNIIIKAVTIDPTRYLTHLPKNYTVGFPRNGYLSHKGILYIKTSQNRKYFFNYILNATISVYKTKKDIKKGEELSFINCKKKSIMLDKFRAMPIIELPKAHYEAKHRIKKDTLLTQRDVTALFLIKRGSQVNVTLQDAGVSISFSGRAVQNGRYGDTIFVVHKNKKIAVIVTGRNRAKVK